MNNHLCPCLSQLPYSECCEPLHKKEQRAKNAQQLMRSRYSAFYLAEVDYLIATLHPSKRRSDERELLQNTINSTTWLGLRILSHQEKNELAEVEFIAFYEDEPIGQLHERSRFTFESDEWFYHDGIILPAIKLGRNDPCFCGSSKKLKRCHG